MSDQTIPVPSNPLVDTNPAETINCCCAVLQLLVHADPQTDQHDQAGFGRCLVIDAIEQALRYESEACRPWSGSVDKEAQS